MTNASVGNYVDFQCSNGGVLTIVGDKDESVLEKFGVDGTFAYYDDLHIDSYNDMKIEVGDQNHVKGTVEHVTGDEVMRFHIHSFEPNGKIDVKLSSLKPFSWYRLQFNGVLAACDGGRAHGKTNEHGIMTFNKVEVPNE